MGRMQKMFSREALAAQVRVLCYAKSIFSLSQPLHSFDTARQPMSRMQKMFSREAVAAQVRLIDSSITQLKAQGPSRTCNESKKKVSSILKDIFSSFPLEKAPLPPDRASVGRIGHVSWQDRARQLASLGVSWQDRARRLAV